MEEGRIHLRAEKAQPFDNRVRLYAAERRGPDLFVAKPIEFVVRRVEGSIGAAFEPILILRPDEAQALVDELWDCGLRPSEGSGSAGSLAATQRHLEDMRALVFKREPRP